MGSLLASHLEQIGSCSQSIAELPFPGPKSFANAILANHDITALIRDTEAHERALFHLAPPVAPGDFGGNSNAVAPISWAALKSRRTTMHAPRQPRSKAVAAVLGNELYAHIQEQSGARQAGDIDVDLLLQGAHKLATVYPIIGALERIAQLKRRYGHLQASIAHFEGRVAQQSAELEKMRNETAVPQLEDEQSTHKSQHEVNERGQLFRLTHGDPDVDLRSMQEEITELERKKKSLEDRVTGMEKDLGGLLR